MKGGTAMNVTDKANIIKILGVAATVIGMGATLLTDWVNDKKMDEKIAEKVLEAIAKKGE
jgi:hypothetical protein